MTPEQTAPSAPAPSAPAAPLTRSEIRKVKALHDLQAHYVLNFSPCLNGPFIARCQRIEETIREEAEFLNGLRKPTVTASTAPTEEVHDE